MLNVQLKQQTKIFKRLERAHILSVYVKLIEYKYNIPRIAHLKIAFFFSAKQNPTS